ncbi:hypothetical protein [Streptomyces sp. NPDC058305]|uniref:hypothetical protein n=1 Tax=Streptomyces sp. NPDC058305 TaxID=3346438 RepID=UPI0036DFC1F4
MLVPSLTVQEAAATSPVLAGALIVFGIGALLLIPSLVWLYVFFQRRDPQAAVASGTPEDGPATL